MPAQTIAFGDWQANLYPGTCVAEEFVQQMAALFPGFLCCASGVHDEYHRILFIPGTTALEQQDYYPVPSWLAKDQQLLWNTFYKELVTAYRQFSDARFLKDTLGIDLRGRFVFSWSPEQGSQRADLFSAFGLEPDDQWRVLLLHCLFLATRWHVEHGGLCLHSTAVAHRQKGFLFLGRSGAGKSTVAQLSASVGYPALGDDLNFIARDGDIGYLLAAAPSPMLSPVGYSMLRPPLRGIFILLQDDRDYLVSLSPMLVARALFDGFLQQTPYVRRLPDEVIGRAFQTIGNIARSVPGYELHFRKSPDFWQVIDEQFPD